MARKTSKTSKPKIRPKGSGNGRQLYWSMVDSTDFHDFFCHASDAGISATPTQRRDREALAIRFWHPDFDLDTIYFGVDEHGERMPERVWEYLAAIIAAVTEEDEDKVRENLKL